MPLLNRMPQKSKRRISVPQLCALWQQYAEFRQPQLAPSTYKRALAFTLFCHHVIALQPLEDFIQALGYL